MNQAVNELLVEGRRKLVAMKEDIKRKDDAAKAEREQKIAQASEAITRVVCGKLPEALWPYLHLDDFQGDFIPFQNSMKLVIPGIQLIKLNVHYNVPEAKISGRWIVVAGIRYSPPQITDDDEVWPGEISFPAETGDRQYGLDVWPYETDDITVALAIATDRYDQFMELEATREKAVESLQAQVDEQDLKRLNDLKGDLKISGQIESTEQISSTQLQVGQLNPLVVIEGWIREIVQDEIKK